MEPEFVEKLLKDSESGSSIVKIINVKNEPAIVKGENYLSQIKRYTITGLLSNGETTTVQWIVKGYPEGENYSKFVQEADFFKTEIYAYSNVLCNMKKLMAEFQDKREIMWSDLIGYKPYNLLILQDLKPLHYCPMNRKEYLDYNHSVLVLKSLARLHAMSAILLKRNVVKPEAFDVYPHAKPDSVKMFYNCCLIQFEKAVRESWGPEWIDLAELAANVDERACDHLQELLKIDNSRFNVVNHGDSWTNNLLFKHEEGTNVPCGLRFVDFQINHYNSFAWDLTYFYYTSILPELRREKYDEFLSVYYKELCQDLQYFNYSKLEMPTLKHLHDEMERLKFYGFILLASVLPWTSAELDVPVDLDIALSNKEQPEIGYNIEMFNCTKYRRLVEPDFKNFLKEGVK